MIEVKRNNRALIVAVLSVLGIWVAAEACTPNREAASKDLLSRKGQCALSELDRTPEQMLIDCAIPKDAKDLQDILDIFVGAQQSALSAGAALPHAQPGIKPRAKDAGK